MAADSLLGEAVRLGAMTDAFAALAAHVRLETEQLPADPAVRELLATIAAEILGNDGPPDLTAAAPAIGLARTVFRLGAELVENPGRSGSWNEVDVPLLQSMGRVSMGIVDALLAAEARLPDLAARLRASGGRFLDIGTGTGWLSIAVARSHPALHITGLDIFEPALELARGNVAESEVGDRIDLRLENAGELDEPDGYDAIWVPLPFLPATVVPGVLAAAVRSLRPGGWVLPGTFAGPPDRLSQLLTDLRTVRSGGAPWRPEEIRGLLTDAGLTEAQEIERTWPAPVRLYAGRH